MYELIFANNKYYDQYDCEGYFASVGACEKHACYILMELINEGVPTIINQPTRSFGKHKDILVELIESKAYKEAVKYWQAVLPNTELSDHTIVINKVKCRKAFAPNKYNPEDLIVTEHPTTANLNIGSFEWLQPKKPKNFYDKLIEFFKLKDN